MDTKPYLEYLDKEMTIMGLLCAVSITAPAGVLSTIAGRDSKLLTAFWSAGYLFIAAGSVMCILASLYFYKQRSYLAWYYGQICLAEVLTTEQSSSSRIREWLRFADCWGTWWPYSWGFDSLLLGFFYYAVALLLLMFSSQNLSPVLNSKTMSLLVFVVPLAIAVMSATTQRYVLTHYKFSDACWSDFKKDIVRRFDRKRRLPHERVYTRLRPSSLHGIGVFAIRQIPEGTYVFEPDDERLVSVHTSAITSLPQEIRRLYEDFCVLHESSYECPASLNKLTLSWYLNDSANPNVAADSSLKFYAIRDIGPGEELTASYVSYSENEVARVSEPIERTERLG